MNFVVTNWRFDRLCVLTSYLGFHQWKLLFKAQRPRNILWARLNGAATWNWQNSFLRRWMHCGFAHNTNWRMCKSFYNSRTPGTTYLCPSLIPEWLGNSNEPARSQAGPISWKTSDKTAYSISPFGWLETCWKHTRRRENQARQIKISLRYGKSDTDCS